MGFGWLYLSKIPCHSQHWPTVITGAGLVLQSRAVHVEYPVCDCGLHTIMYVFNQALCHCSMCVDLALSIFA